VVTALGDAPTGRSARAAPAAPVLGTTTATMNLMQHVTDASDLH
jgi:hypothetical protein